MKVLAWLVVMGCGAPAAGACPPISAHLDKCQLTQSMENVDVQPCRRPGDPPATGHVRVTFQPDGTVSNAVLDGGSFGGTSVGACILEKFKAAKAPPYTDDPLGQTVGRSFVIH